jgi:hypothetical protein
MPRKPNPLYIRKSTNFRFTNEDITIEPSIFQPTPDGIDALCHHYREKYSIDLLSIDLRGKIVSGDNALHFFNYLRDNQAELLNLDEGQARGLVLNHGQHHAIPVLICKKENEKHMVVFDSSSGSRINGYFNMADLFPDTQFYLNAGTRQSDEGSCMTDAICILKEALQIENLISLIQSKNIAEHRAFNPTLFKTLKIEEKRKPANFKLFRMPEQLLVTAQSSKYISDAEADLDMVLRGGQTLRYYRETYTMQVSLAKNEQSTPTNISSYLYLKGKEHKEILDNYWKAHKKVSRVDSSTPDELEDESVCTSYVFFPIEGQEHPNVIPTISR